MRRSPIVLSLVVIASISGCATVNEYEGSHQGPWVAAGLRSREFVREVLPAYSPVSAKTTYWSDARGSRVPAVEFTDRIASYWESLGKFGHWPRYELMSREETNSGMRPQTVIISIHPIVVIICQGGSDFSPPSFRERARLSGNTTVISRDFVFEYGTGFFDRKAVFWFSPDLGIPPTAVEIDRSSGTLRIEHPQVSIRARLSNHVWQAERLR